MRAVSGVLALLLPAACSAFVYQPAVGQIWDPSVLRWNGSFYAVSMYSPKGDKQYPSGFLSRSSDGVHWQDVGPIAPSHPNTSWWKGFPLQRPDGTFVLNHGVYDTHGADNTTRDGNDALRILTSANLQDWTEVATSKPDARWYKSTRWDHMYMKRVNDSFIGPPPPSRPPPRPGPSTVITHRLSRTQTHARTTRTHTHAQHRHTRTTHTHTHTRARTTSSVRCTVRTPP